MFDIPMDLRSLEKEIVAYEQEPIEKGKILFYGHSLFTRWGSGKWAEQVRPMAQDICMKDGTPAVVNHGFGTSTTEERLYYYDRMVRPWEPRALVLANWGNDSMYGYSPEQSMHATAQLLAWARADFPGIKLFLVDMHPTAKAKRDTEIRPGVALPDKWNNKLRERTAIREMLQIYAQTHEDTEFISLWDKPDFFEEGHVGDFRYVRDELFMDDMVHPNQAGYDILGPIFRKALAELL